MNLFDRYEKTTHAAVARMMGDDATWYPSDGSVTTGIVAKVLFNNPTKQSKINGVEFDPAADMMEFYKDSFPRLKELVDAGESETVTIKETEYYVTKVTANWDGDISKADLIKKD